MSVETLNIDTGASLEAASIYEPQDRTPDYVNPNLDDSELFGLVSQNSSVIVELNGAEMTLSEAMHQIPINEATYPSVLATVYELLAQAAQKEKNEELADEELVDEQEEEAGETIEDNEKPDLDKAEESKKPALAKADEKIEIKKSIPEEVKADIKKAEPATTESNNEPELAEPAESFDVLETSSPISETESKIEKSPVPAGPAVKIIQGPPAEVAAESSDKAPAPETTKTFLGADDQDILQITTEAAVSEPVAIQSAKENEPKTEQPLTEAPEVDSVMSSLETLEQHDDNLSGQSLEQAFVEYAPNQSEDEMGADEVWTREIDETFPDQLLNETSLAKIPIAQGSLDNFDTEKLETKPRGLEFPIGNRQPDQLENPPMETALIEELEQTIIGLDENFVNLAPETEDLVIEIVDKIIVAPAKLETEDIQITEMEIQAELEELFVRLLDQLDIEYTPGLVDSLAKITINLYFTGNLETLKREQPKEIVHDAGTHEIIKQLLASAKAFKKAMARAGAIGQSVLRLYDHAQQPILANT